MQLNLREQGHKSAGHWHFDPHILSQDYAWLTEKINDRTCDWILAGAADKISVAQPVAPLKSRSLEYTCEEHKKDREEAQSYFLDAKLDANLAWFYLWHPDSDTDYYKHLEQVVSSQLKLKPMANVSNIWGKSTPILFALQAPGQICTNHIDHHYTDYDTRKDRFTDPGYVKVIVFLSDWQPGQYFVFGNSLVDKWQKGQALVFPWGIPHWTYNFTNKNRITMMVKVNRHENNNLPI